MPELKPCPFCGNDNQNFFRYSFKKDRKKRFGVYYDICEIYCDRCTASVRQAGPGREKAQEYAEKRWNGRTTAMTGINEAAKEIHENARAHGWWDEERGFPEVLALIHSEISEALEEYRKGHGATEIYYGDNGKPEGIPIELADTIIRILDYCGYAGIDIDAAITEKHGYNKSRPFRHGGKKC